MVVCDPRQAVRHLMCTSSYINSISFSTGYRTLHPDVPGPEGVYCRPAAAPHIAGVRTEPQVSGSCLHDC